MDATIRDPALEEFDTARLLANAREQASKRRYEVIWIESGLAWAPFLMQRLDNEYVMRSAEAPGLKKKPSDFKLDPILSDAKAQRRAQRTAVR